MTLTEYFIQVLTKIESNDFELVVFDKEPDSDKLSIHIEALNYILYEWNEDNKDERNIFDYILKPNDSDWDFTSITFDEFFDFVTSQKDKDNITINIKTGEASGKVNKSIKEPKKTKVKEESKEKPKETKKTEPKGVKTKEVEPKTKPKETKKKIKKEPIVRERRVFEKYDSNDTSPSEIDRMTGDDWDF